MVGCGFSGRVESEAMAKVVTVDVGGGDKAGEVEGVPGRVVVETRHGLQKVPPQSTPSSSRLRIPSKQVGLTLDKPPAVDPAREESPDPPSV